MAATLPPTVDPMGVGQRLALSPAWEAYLQVLLRDIAHLVADRDLNPEDLSGRLARALCALEGRP